MRAPALLQAAVQGAATAGGAAAVPSGATQLVYGGGWFRDEAGAQQAVQAQCEASLALPLGPQAQQAQQRQRVGSGPDSAELPASYSLPIPTALLMGLGAQQQQQQGSAWQAHERVAAVPARDLPLPSSALLGGPQLPQQAQQVPAAGDVGGPGAAGLAPSGLVTAQPLQPRGGMPAAPDSWAQQQSQQAQQQAAAALERQQPATSMPSTSFEFCRGPQQYAGATLRGGAAANAPGAQPGAGAAVAAGQQAQVQQQAHALASTYQQQQQGPLTAAAYQQHLASQAAAAAAAQSATAFAALPPGWQPGMGSGGAIPAGLDLASAALQQALSAQLSTQLTQE